MTPSETALESRTRRAATKSRWRAGTIDNRRGFQLIEPYTNTVF